MQDGRGLHVSIYTGAALLPSPGAGRTGDCIGDLGKIMRRLAKIGLGVLALAVIGGGGLYLFKARQPANAVATAPVSPIAAPRFEGLEFSPADLAEARTADLRRAVRLSGSLQ